MVINTANSPDFSPGVALRLRRDSPGLQLHRESTLAAAERGAGAAAPFGESLKDGENMESSQGKGEKHGIFQFEKW